MAYSLSGRTGSHLSGRLVFNKATRSCEHRGWQWSRSSEFERLLGQRNSEAWFGAASLVLGIHLALVGSLHMLPFATFYHNYVLCLRATYHGICWACYLYSVGTMKIPD